MSRLLARRNSGGCGGAMQLAMPGKLEMPQTMKLQSENERNEHPYAKLTALNAKYVITSEVLGSGTSAVVKRATRKDDSNAEVAVKLMNTSKDEGLCGVIQREFDLIKELRHPTIIQAYELFIAPDRTLAGLCMELVRGSTLKAIVKKSGAIAEGTMRPLFKQLIVGLSYLHRKRIIHRDLKPDNLLIEDKLDRLRICDFNVARKLTDGGTLTPLVTEQQFTAPEVLLCDAKMGERSDIWGAGVCLHYALTGGMTFASISRVEHYDAHKLGLFLSNVSDEQRLKWIEKPGLSWDSSAVNVLWGCTHPDVSQRPEPSLLMAHPWLSRIGDVAGQEPTKNVRIGLPADAMETCAIRVCSIGFGSHPDAGTWQPDTTDDKAINALYNTGNGTSIRIDSLGNVKRVETKDVSTIKNVFWTTPNVEDIDTTEEDLFDTSKLDENLYVYHDVSRTTSPYSSRTNSRRPTFFSCASPSDVQSLVSPKFLRSPESFVSPRKYSDETRSLASPKSLTSPKHSAQQTADQVPNTLAAALERLAQGSGGHRQSHGHACKTQDCYPGGHLSQTGRTSPKMPNVDKKDPLNMSKDVVSLNEKISDAPRQVACT